MNTLRQDLMMLRFKHSINTSFKYTSIETADGSVAIKTEDIEASVINKYGVKKQYTNHLFIKMKDGKLMVFDRLGFIDKTIDIKGNINKLMNLEFARFIRKYEYN